jgi:fatty-acyl-CoA synthase
MPVNGIDIRIVDAEGNDLPHDGTSQGEVLLRGPWIIERYHKLDDDADKFSGGYWRSGDVGRIDTNGYLKLTDRLKDVVKSGGEWISSIDMENALVGHPKIKEAAVVGVPHPKWQERPLALVVTVDGTEVDITEIHGVLDGTFAKWQFPDTVLFVDALPRTSVGKLDKKVLRSRHAEFYTEKR